MANAHIKLNLKKDLFVPKFYPMLFDYSNRWEVYMGSAGSAKSYFITQKLIIRACNEKIKILVCRRTGTTIRNTCFSLFKDILTKWKLTPYVKIRESSNYFYHRSRNILCTHTNSTILSDSLENLSPLLVVDNIP